MNSYTPNSVRTTGLSRRQVIARLRVEVRVRARVRGRLRLRLGLRVMLSIMLRLPELSELLQHATLSFTSPPPHPHPPTHTHAASMPTSFPSLEDHPISHPRQIVNLVLFPFPHPHPHPRGVDWTRGVRACSAADHERCAPFRRDGREVDSNGQHAFTPSNKRCRMVPGWS